MLKDQIAIIGCGSLGSILAQKIMLYSSCRKVNLNLDLENNNENNSESEGLKKLLLIDHDIIESKNLPYLSIYPGENKYLFLDKVYVLSDLLRPIDPSVQIVTSIEKFPVPDSRIPDTYLRIDCRDTHLVDSEDIDIKINYDGLWGRIRLFPEVYKEQKNKFSRYHYGINRYLIEKFCFYLIDKYISKWDIYEKEKIPIELSIQLETMECF